MPEPAWMVLGRLNEPLTENIVLKCYSCDMPIVLRLRFEPYPDGPAVFSGSRVMPHPPPPALNLPLYEKTDIASYYEEAWRCRRGGQRRAAVVMARSTLQAVFRRYLSDGDRGSFTAEMDKVAELAGPGWSKVGSGVRDFGNKWAHPEGDLDPPPWEEVAEAFDRLKDVLEFTASMEKYGHLNPTDEGRTL